MGLGLTYKLPAGIDALVEHADRNYARAWEINSLRPDPQLALLEALLAEVRALRLTVEASSPE